MSKADYSYPDDEFDAPTGPDVPRGVHRAPISAWSRWWPFVVVIIVVPALAYALVTWASRDNTTTDSGTPEASASAPQASGTPTTSAEPSTTPSEAPSDTPTQTEEATPTESPASVELDTPVVVYNAAGISGLAASTVTKLEGAGFTAAKADNFSGAKPGQSTVYYASEDLEPTAALVGETIGVDALELSASDAGDGISAVLISDPSK
ncbi:MAG: LytR C-terminal domain-containing protein [Brevundimonas sp.]